MMLGLQGSTSSSKVFRCVACSATFTGLASLLVHQATHASSLSRAATPPQPNSGSQETLLSNINSFSERPGPSTLFPESPLPSLYICDCGEEFQDFNQMLEHKQSHGSQPMDSSTPSELGCDKAQLTQNLSLNPIINQQDLVPGCLSNSRPPAAEIPSLTHKKADESLEEGYATATTTKGQCTPSLDERDHHLQSMSTMSEIAENILSQSPTNSVLSSQNNLSLPQNNALMKLLASAYTKSSPASQSQDQDDFSVAPKQEAVQVDITPGSKTEVPSINDLSVAQLRRLLAKPGIKTKAPSISKVLECSKKRIVSLTKTFSPVVVLETRQKLKDPGNKGTYGKYQCGRCRRVFQDLDRLTEHHFLHKKERIKCCRRCKQLIIGRLPLRDNHICPYVGNNTTQLSSSLKNKSLFGNKIMPFHSQNNARKVFFCPLCKHSYARRWNLKMHKCQGPRSDPSGLDTSSIQKGFVLRSNSKTPTELDVNAGSEIAKSIAVGTEVFGHVKVEMTSPEQSAVSQFAWAHPAKSPSPLNPKPTIKDQSNNAAMHGILLQPEGSSCWDVAASGKEDGEQGQWTVPLDDELELLNSAGKTGNGAEGTKTLLVKNAETASSSLRYFVKDGVKRYPCTRCQKTYSRPCTLRRHLRLCGFRPRGLGPMVQGSTPGAMPFNANINRPMFPCFICGRVFNRKDNMMVHRRKCQLHRTVSGAVGGLLQQSMPVTSANGQTQVDDGGNWGIMSLPSVLPRRVTCECGVGFTSPRLLLEHLQKHAQESYTCPTCGETVSSWADYEVHLQIHMHPHHQLLKGIQPQRSQPLLVRFQQQRPQPQPPQQQPPQQQQQPSHSAHQPPQKQTIKVAAQVSDLSTKQQRHACTRCGNTFATRCSLRRHLTWNRCKGARVSNQPSNPPKSYHCSHCNSDFPNTISLLFHQRSGACKPSIKPVRCPVCLRWFGTVDSLQKHLLTHKQSESYHCDVCQGTYPSLKSLKNHRRRIHRIMAGDSNSKTQEQLVP